MFYKGNFRFSFGLSKFLNNIVEDMIDYFKFISSLGLECFRIYCGFYLKFIVFVNSKKYYDYG